MKWNVETEEGMRRGRHFEPTNSFFKKKHRQHKYLVLHVQSGREENRSGRLVGNLNDGPLFAVCVITIGKAARLSCRRSAHDLLGKKMEEKTKSEPRTTAGRATE
jgi:hypothetical protein